MVHATSNQKLDSILDHFAIAVSEWEDFRNKFVEKNKASMMIDAHSDIQRITQYQFSNKAKLETLAIIQNAATGQLSNFLERHGESLHHVTLKVKNVPKAIELMEQSGYDVTGANTSGKSRHEAYLSVKVSGNIPIQFLWTDVDDVTWARRRGFEPQINEGNGLHFLGATLPHSDLPSAARLWQLLGAEVNHETLDSHEVLICKWQDTSMNLILDPTISKPLLRWFDSDSNTFIHESQPFH